MLRLVIPAQFMFPSSQQSSTVSPFRVAGKSA